MLLNFNYKNPGQTQIYKILMKIKKNDRDMRFQPQSRSRHQMWQAPPSGSVQPLYRSTLAHDRNWFP